VILKISFSLGVSRSPPKGKSQTGTQLSQTCAEGFINKHRTAISSYMFFCYLLMFLCNWGVQYHLIFNLIPPSPAHSQANQQGGFKTSKTIESLMCSRQQANRPTHNTTTQTQAKLGLEQIQTQMTQKPMLRAEVYARRCAQVKIVNRKCVEARKFGPPPLSKVETVHKINLGAALSPFCVCLR